MPIDTRMPNERIADLEKKVEALETEVKSVLQAIDALRTAIANRGT